MKLIIKTTYESFDKEFLDWWIESNGPNYGIKDELDMPKVYQNKDPWGPGVATTIIEVVK